MDEIVEDDRSPELPLLVDVGVAILEDHHRQPLVADFFENRLGREMDPNAADGVREDTAAVVDEHPRRAGVDASAAGRACAFEDVVLVPVGILPAAGRGGGEEGREREQGDRERGTHGNPPSW